jgi:APA family basic amino acid/polyamine antiporter
LLLLLLLLLLAPCAGFDAVATSAEEVRNPKRDLPLGILGALCIVTICYILMSLALVMMVPISALQEAGSFAAAFQYVGMDWARYIVALGALLGIITGAWDKNNIEVHGARCRELPRAVLYVPM